jgi:hypothetical protein
MQPDRRHQGKGRFATVSETTSLRDFKRSMNELNRSFIEFTKSSDNYAKKLVWLTWGLVALTVLLIFLTVFTIRDTHESASLQNNIALNGQFYARPNLDALFAIDYGHPILTENGGKLNKTELDTYLGAFDTIKAAYDRGLLNEDDLCISFSYYISITASNSEVKEHMEAQQKYDESFFSAFRELFEMVSKSKNAACQRTKEAAYKATMKEPPT